MDKFGIFNLLSALTGGENKNSQSENKDNGGNSPDLSGLLSALTGGKNEKTPPPNPKPNDTPREFKPLQTSMLDTITRHNEIIKRVKARQK